MIAWLVVGGCAAVAIPAIAAFWGARALAKAKQRKAVEEARQRMDSIADDNLPSTAKRLRDTHFCV